MKTITFTEFRRHSSTLLREVEQGETLIILRHSKPIAEIKAFSNKDDEIPALKKPGIKVQYSGAELSTAILAERETGLEICETS
jgi:antitoxin (DNA-binding transcriptional repressor) of toxin-antitoxin stability system